MNQIEERGRVLDHCLQLSYRSTSVMLAHIFSPWTVEPIFVCPLRCVSCSFFGTPPECQWARLRCFTIHQYCRPHLHMVMGTTLSASYIVVILSLNLHSFFLSWLNSQVCKYCHLPAKERSVRDSLVWALTLPTVVWNTLQQTQQAEPMRFPTPFAF